jgi:hypothetical protein
MVERTPEPRDLVAELRRVDDAFAQLKPSRRDDLERLIDGDTDELVRQSNRALTRQRLRTAFAMGGSAAIVVALLAVATSSAPSTPAIAVAMTTPATATAAAAVPVLAVAPTTPIATVTPTATPTVTPIATPTVTTSSRAVAIARLQRLQGLAVAREWGTLSSSSLESLSPLVAIDGRLGSTAAGAIDGAMVGVADAVVDRVTDDDVQGALLEARSLSQRGAPADAARVLAALLARAPSPRVVDVVSSEQASLLARSGQVDEACAVWSAHRQRFSSSENAAAVVAALARWQCP